MSRRNGADLRSRRLYESCMRMFSRRLGELSEDVVVNDERGARREVPEGLLQPSYSDEDFKRVRDLARRSPSEAARGAYDALKGEIESAADEAADAIKRYGLPDGMEDWTLRFEGAYFVTLTAPLNGREPDYAEYGDNGPEIGFFKTGRVGRIRLACSADEDGNPSVEVSDDAKGIADEYGVREWIPGMLRAAGKEISELVGYGNTASLIKGFFGTQMGTGVTGRYDDEWRAASDAYFAKDERNRRRRKGQWLPTFGYSAGWAATEGSMYTYLKDAAARREMKALANKRDYSGMRAAFKRIAAGAIESGSLRKALARDERMSNPFKPISMDAKAVVREATADLGRSSMAPGRDGRTAARSKFDQEWTDAADMMARDIERELPDWLTDDGEWRVYRGNGTRTFKISDDLGSSATLAFDGAGAVSASVDKGSDKDAATALRRLCSDDELLGRIEDAVAEDGAEASAAEIKERVAYSWAMMNSCIRDMKAADRRAGRK